MPWLTVGLGEKIEFLQSITSAGTYPLLLNCLPLHVFVSVSCFRAVPLRHHAPCCSKPGKMSLLSTERGNMSQEQGIDKDYINTYRQQGKDGDKNIERFKPSTLTICDYNRIDFFVIF